MGELSEGVEVEVETESLSKLSVAEVGLALLPRARRQPQWSEDMWALAEEVWTPSLTCAQPMEPEHLLPQTIVFLSSRCSFSMVSSGHLCALVHIYYVFKI